MSSETASEHSRLKAHNSLYHPNIEESLIEERLAFTAFICYHLFMNIRPETANWLRGSDYDLESARQMLLSKRYLYVVFLCHLALEKMLKALVSEAAEAPAPRSHDLIYLVKRSGIVPDSGRMQFIGLLNNASTATRYPEDMERAINDYPVDVAEDYLRKTEDVISWLKKQFPLKK